MELRDWLKALMYVPLMFYQFYLSWRYYNNLELDWLANLGWFLLGISALFGWLPIFEFKNMAEYQKIKAISKQQSL
jgi:hypothetical protein